MFTCEAAQLHSLLCGNVIQLYEENLTED